MLTEILGGLTKVFTSLGTGAAQLGSAVRAVGTTLFTGMAATGSGLSGGGLNSLLGGGGVLSNILGGALKQGLAGGLAGGLVGTISGEGFGAGFKQGAMTGAISGGVQGLFTPTGFGSAIGGDIYNQDVMAGGIGNSPMAGGALTGGVGANTLSLGGAGTDTYGTVGPPGFSHAGTEGAGAYGAAATGAPNVFPAAPPMPNIPDPTLGGWKGLGGFLQSNAGAGLIGGIGESLMAERMIEAQMENAEANRDFIRERDQKVTDSYEVADDAYLFGTGKTAAAPAAKAKPKWEYDPKTGMIGMT